MVGEKTGKVSIYIPLQGIIKPSGTSYLYNGVTDSELKDNLANRSNLKGKLVFLNVYDALDYLTDLPFEVGVNPAILGFQVPQEVGSLLQSSNDRSLDDLIPTSPVLVYRPNHVDHGFIDMEWGVRSYKLPK